MSITGIVAARDKFPSNRKASCCMKLILPGESVVIYTQRERGKVNQYVCLHRRCLLKVLENLPLDTQEAESKFDRLREAMVREGNAFPKGRANGKRRSTA